MTVRILAFLWVSALFGADELQLALGLKAQSDFERVALPALPQLRDTSTCIQSQAAFLPVVSPQELPLVHYRKGYCALAEAALSHNTSEFKEAASDFDAVIATWPGRFAKKSKLPPEPVSSGVRVLAAISRLHAGTDRAAVERAWGEISAAESEAACPTIVMPAERCADILRTGRLWLGWMALRQGDLPAAARQFADSASTGWPQWTVGRQAFHDRKYAEAVRVYREAVGIWRARDGGGPSVTAMVSPRPDLPGALVDLGGAELLAGNAAAGIRTLDSAIQLDPSAARAYYLRARAKEAAGQNEAAAADYSQASRRALANAKDQASGEGHFYRALLLYRRKQFAQSEDELAEALNSGIPLELRADAAAWRHLAAVSGGSCGTERDYLEQSLAAVSPYFPKREARTAMAACPATATAGVAVNVVK
jgi:tetratricopeptide (TPR) repeat protein